MTYLRFVCLFALTLSAAFAAFAQSPALQKGVSVKMAVTNHATPVPEADAEDAFIVAVTADGTTYLGVSPTTVAELAEKVRSTPFKRGQGIYIKADARARWAFVRQVLAATQNPGIAPQILLTGQSESPRPGTLASPMGLEVTVGQAAASGSIATVVELRNSADQQPSPTVNGDAVDWSALESTLRRHFEKGDDKLILLKADERLPYAQVAQVIDMCRGAGAKVVVSD